MIATKNPVILYWLYASGALTHIRTKLQAKFGAPVSLDCLKLNGGEEFALSEIAQKFNKEIADETALYRVESHEGLVEEMEKHLRGLLKTHSEHIVRIINCQNESSKIKKFLETNKLTTLLLEFNNYYQLMDLTYVFIKNSLYDEIMRSLGKNQPNESLNQQAIYHKEPELKVEDLTLGTKIGEFEGGELWNCKHRSIPHTYIKFKDQSWQTSAKISLLHSSHPSYFPTFNLFAPISLLKPSPQKLPQLFSFLQTLQYKYPTHYPSCDSIFQHQGKLVIFTKENGYKINLGWLCYHVAYGEISYQAYLRWVRHNEMDPIAKWNREQERDYEMKGM